MENNKFNFCPECGSKNILTEDNGRKWKCPDCGFTLYNNVAAAVGLVIVNSRNEVLLEKRAKEPRKGYLAFPGGFVDPDETLDEAARRECREEIGTEISSIKYIASFPNTYEYKNVVYKTCDVFFEAMIAPQAELKFQRSEVAEIVWYPCGTKEDVEKIPLAFDSARKTLLTRI
ncbi:NUDIX domain-containing protein [Treponema sp.]|uniref:NUDIX hydrolase n=1 Tax=Treponema sp. TaxID=166 RepID=UPI00388EE1FD